MSAVYVYALTDAALAPVTVGGRTLEAIPVGGIYVVAERTAERPPVSEEALRMQHRAVERIASAADAVLPARFGSLVDLAELQRIVSLRGDVLRAALDLVRGRQQMSVRVVGEDRSAPAPAAAPPTTGTEYLRARIRVVPEASASIEAVRRAVADLVVAERVEGGSGHTLATVYHLVEGGSAGRYRRRLARVARSLAGIAIRVTGPWPAFAFAPELVA